MMQRISNIKWLRAQITEEEAQKAKNIAKDKGMTLQGWVGALIKKEIHNSTSEKTITESSADSSLSFDSRRQI